MPILYSFKRCPYAMRARMALFLGDIKCEIREIRLKNKPDHMMKVSPKGTVPVLILKNKVIDESMDIINWVMEQKNIFKLVKILQLQKTSRKFIKIIMPYYN